MSKGTAKKVGLVVFERNGWIKTVNSKEVPTLEIARGVEMKLGDWTSKVPIEVISLDDYDLVIGLNFLNRIHALLVPFVNCICILDPEHQCVVQVR